MKKRKREFIFTDQPEPHRERTKTILKSHPEIRTLISRSPVSVYIILGIVALQLTISILLSENFWWLALMTAYLIGAFANHTLFVLIHECSHNLIFKSKTMNMIVSILADIPNTIPTAISFRSYHIKHHSFHGNYYLDADIASRWEARLIGNSLFGKALWLFLFPVFQGLRPPRLKEIKFGSTWTFINWFIVFGLDIALIYYFGWISFLYLIASLFFAIGLHPLGARWIQEHYLTYPPQETYSYYGPLNVLALNVGYHNEHHDFPSIPWNKLPKLKSLAPEFYNNLHFHKSWTKLLFKFLFDPNLSLYSRMIRTNRDGLALDKD